MSKKNRPWLVILGGFFVFCLDQGLKFLSRNYQTPTSSFPIGWEYYENTGIAFSLPVDKSLTITFTPIILFFLLFLLYKYRLNNNKLWASLGIILIIYGSMSNFIDRIFFGFTIDYIRFFTSVINLADVLIVGGAALLLSHEWINKHEGK